MPRCDGFRRFLRRSPACRGHFWRVFGHGACFAECLATHLCDLVLVLVARLTALAHRLAERDVRPEIIVADLADPDALARVAARAAMTT